MLAAVLRFSGLSWGLRHGAIEAERDFVQSVWEMVAARDLDQRFYEYPGLFFHLLYVPIAAVQMAGRPEPTAYLVARGVVAAFGVLSVALTFVLGSRLAGPRLGLLAALFLAVSPLEIETAHRVRTDVVLEAFGLLALLAFRRVGADWRGDARAGICLGLATALKPTGVLLLPSYLLHRHFAPGPRATRIALVGVLALVVVVALTPYFLIAPQKFLGGAWTQVSYFFAHDQWAAKVSARPDAPSRDTGSGVVSRPDLILFYLGNVVALLGPAGAVLALAGIVLARRAAPTWLPLLALPLTILAVVCSAQIGHARLLVPAGGVLALFAARGLDGLWERWPRAGAALAAIAVALPLSTSVTFARGIARPTPQDQALDWIVGRVPAGARILATPTRLGVDSDRYNVALAGRRTAGQNRLVAREVDLVVAEPRDPIVEGLTEVYRAEAAVPQAGPTLGLFVAPAAARVSYQPVPCRQARLSASAGPEGLPLLVDGDRATVWKMREPQPRPWIALELPAPVRVGRVWLVLRRPLGSELRLLTSEDGTSWQEPLAAAFQTTASDPVVLTLLLEPTRARGLRLEAKRSVPLQWAVSEMGLDAVVDGAP